MRQRIVGMSAMLCILLIHAAGAVHHRGIVAAGQAAGSTDSFQLDEILMELDMAHRSGIIPLVLQVDSAQRFLEGKSEDEIVAETTAYARRMTPRIEAWQQEGTGGAKFAEVYLVARIIGRDARRLLTAERGMPPPRNRGMEYLEAVVNGDAVPRYAERLMEEELLSFRRRKADHDPVGEVFRPLNEFFAKNREYRHVWSALHLRRYGFRPGDPDDVVFRAYEIVAGDDTPLANMVRIRLLRNRADLPDHVAAAVRDALEQVVEDSRDVVSEAAERRERYDRANQRAAVQYGVAILSAVAPDTGAHYRALANTVFRIDDALIPLRRCSASRC